MFVREKLGLATIQRDECFLLGFDSRSHENDPIAVMASVPNFMYRNLEILLYSRGISFGLSYSWVVSLRLRMAAQHEPNLIHGVEANPFNIWGHLYERDGSYFQRMTSDNTQCACPRPKGFLGKNPWKAREQENSFLGAELYNKKEKDTGNNWAEVLAQAPMVADSRGYASQKAHGFRKSRCIVSYTCLAFYLEVFLPNNTIGEEIRGSFLLFLPFPLFSGKGRSC